MDDSSNPSAFGCGKDDRRESIGYLRDNTRLRQLLHSKFLFRSLSRGCGNREILFVKAGFDLQSIVEGMHDIAAEGTVLSPRRGSHGFGFLHSAAN